MNDPAVDLLLRMAREAAGAQRCSGCGRSLRSGGVDVRDHAADRLLIDVTCRGCGHVMQLEIRPDAPHGVARTG